MEGKEMGQRRLLPLASSALIMPTWIPSVPDISRRWPEIVSKNNSLLKCHEGQWNKLLYHAIAGAPETVTEIHHLPFPSSNFYFPHPQPEHFRNSKVLACCKDPDCDPHQTFLYWESLLQLTDPCYHKHRGTKTWLWILRESPRFHYIAATSLPPEDGLSHLNQSDNLWFWLSTGMKSPKWAYGSHSCMIGHILTEIPGCDRKHSVGK